MTFYEELQLSSTGSKALIKNTTDPKEKRRHILIYNFKVYLVMAFCFVFVTLFSMLFGSDNSVAGVVFLLALLVLRQADFGIRTSHGLICIAGIFTLLITGPRLANTLPAPASLLVNFISILLLMILGCHNVIMYNQSTFVLGYLLLYGYDVTGRAYLLRVLGLLVSMMVCMLVFYKNQKKRPYRRSFPDLFREFNLKSARSQWYLSLTWIVCSAMFIMQLLSLPRAMWAGIACMSVCLPFPEDSKDRTWKRGVFNILGCGIFLVLYNPLPAWLYPYIGVIGGIGVGYSAGYSWQTVFNTFGALSIAGSLFGVKTAIALRIGTNVAGALYAFLSWHGFSAKKITPPWRYPQNNHTLHRHFFPALAEGFPDDIHYSLPPPDPAFCPGSSGSTGFSVPRPGYTDTTVHCGYNYSTVPAYHMQTRTDLTACGLP